MQILLTRLDNSRTDNFALRFVRFYHFFSAMSDKGLGADLFISIADQIQAKLVTHTRRLDILADRYFSVFSSQFISMSSYLTPKRY